MSLKEYVGKRNFDKTSEPKGKKAGSSAHRFVVQKHDASRLHYDFRLEVGGTLKSWAVPKGLPYAHGEKHLAVQVEDHPIDYADFEGAIPKGQYGGGTVMVWDRGTFEPLSKVPLKELEAGKMHVILNGEKLKGEWYLVRLRDGDNQWLVIKGGESMKPVSKKLDDRSVLSGKSMKELSRGDRVWQSREAFRGNRIGLKSKRAGAGSVLPAFVQPMKAKLAAKPPAGDWMYEIKFNGWRALALKGGSQSRLLSRSEKDFGARFPEIMQSIADLDATDAVLDGEIVGLDEKGRSSFELLQAYDFGQNRPPIFYYAFDILHLNGRDMKDQLLAERKSQLEKLLKNPPGAIRYSATLGNDANALLQQIRRLGLEGVIGKRKNSIYEPGRRSGSWIKLKLVLEQKFVIGGYSKGAHQNSGLLVVGYYENKEMVFAGKVETGVTAILLRRLHSRFQKIASESCPFTDLPVSRAAPSEPSITASEMKHFHWVEPSIVCQIKFAQWTRSGCLREPVFLGLREDEIATDVIRERT